MKYPAKASADFEAVPAGSHLGLCNMIVDLGMQPGSGMYPDPKPQVHIRFEIPEEVREFNGKQAPMVIGRTFTASMSKKANLRKFVEGWRGKPFKDDDEAGDFEFKKLGGQSALLNIQHVERGSKTYANIHGASPLPKGMKNTQPQHNDTLYYSLDKPDQEIFNKLPKWLQEKITNRLKSEPQEKIDPGVVTPTGEDDDIPF